MNSIAQKKKGGPRAGGGTAVRDAMWAAGMLCSTWAKDCNGSALRRAAGGGGALLVAHSGQSSVTLTDFWVPSSVLTSTFMTPEPEQISSIAWGLTRGEAIATPIDKANHTSTKRARR